MTTDIHEAILTPDDRGRFHVRRFLPRPTPSRWKLFLEDGGRRLILEAID